jgi:hypothetical protein
VFTAVALGALLYDGACLVVGFLYGDAATGLVGQLVFPLGFLEPLAGLFFLLFWLVRARRHLDRVMSYEPLKRSSRVRAGALAGALATSGATMLSNALVYLLGPLLSSPLVPTVLNVVHLLGVVLVGVLWGVLYAGLDLRWGANWPDWLRGLSFAMVPFGALLMAAEPAEWLAGVNEALRWAVYGALLGLIYPVLRARRVVAVAKVRVLADSQMG